MRGSKRDRERQVKRGVRGSKRDRERQVKRGGENE